MSDPMSDFTEHLRSLANFKVPAMPDMDRLASAYRRNVEVLTEANKVALEGAQAVARRHMEIVQQSMTDMTESLKTLATSEAPQAQAAKQAELLKQAYERALDNTRELSDMIKQSNAEALGLLNTRFMEAMDEVKHLVDQSKPAGDGPQAP